MAKRVYRSMQGKIVDMELLANKNELTPAIGNVRVNARGDELGPGGRIIRKREDIMAEYYENNPGAVRDEQYVRPAQTKAATGPAPRLTSPNVSPETEHRDTRRTTVKKEVKTTNEDNKSDS